MSESNGQLQGKKVLVTGSVSGIGEAIARRFAAEGACVMLHGPKAGEGDGVVGPIREAGGEAHFLAAALEQPDQCAELIARTVEQLGGLDILVNNAAAIIRSNLADTTAATFDYSQAVNVRAPLLLVQAAVPHFRTVGRGCVLNIGSINAYTGERNLLAYSVSKGALMTLSRNLADSLATENIRVNHFNLGWVLTPNEYAAKIRDGLPADWPEHLPPAFAPSGRILKPEEIAHFALAFVSDGGGPISGAVVELEQYPVIGRNPDKG